MSEHGHHATIGLVQHAVGREGLALVELTFLAAGDFENAVGVDDDSGRERDGQFHGHEFSVNLRLDFAVQVDDLFDAFGKHRDAKAQDRAKHRNLLGTHRPHL